jgi:tetratricopeptide (TPR) repeat protein
LSSKLRKLKQQAFEAGRKRDWNGAADAYAQLLELDKSNPSLLNEYGDVCLKAGDQAKALRQFLAAASKYRQNGLLNNAQAVYKKVLRHDAGNLNANWFLAEIRAAQGLAAEGEHYALTFLNQADEVSGEIKEIFHKRCLELFELYPESDPILDRVEQVFRLWDMALEAARAGCLRACLRHRGGDAEGASEAIAQICSRVPEIVNYAEYVRWQELLGGPAATPTAFADVNTIDLDAAEPAPAPAAPEAVEDAALPAAPGSAQDDAADRPAAAFEEFLENGGELETSADGSPFVDDAPVDEPGEEPSGAPVAVDADLADEDELDRDDEGCISIDLEQETSFADLLDSMETPAVDAAGPTEPDDAVEPVAATGQVNLLDEILAEEGEDILRSSDTEQVSTIASEIGRNLGNAAAADPQSQYDQGMVYLEMGLYDQAALAFRGAAADPSHAVRAREMWGIALQRDGRLEEAVAVLRDGMQGASDDDRAVLGLHYHAGRILEELGRGDEAHEHYQRVHAVDAGFADVAQRLRTLV